MNPGQRPWPAPAKLNLFIHVTGRRVDGYHELQSVFQFLDLEDALWITPREDDRLILTGDRVGTAPADNLVVRAAEALRAAAGTRQGAEIRLEKRIPVGGGLGGGSSDAATALVALNQLWGLGRSREELAAIGLRLGSDVPVFVRGLAAWAEGVGERLRPLPGLPEPWYALVHPGISVSTAEIYAAPELTRDAPPITISGFLAGRGGNSFLPVVRSRYREVGEALDWLGQRGEARLTGTGACVFAAFASRAAAQAALRELPAGWRGFVARGLNRSPLLDRAASGETA